MYGYLLFENYYKWSLLKQNERDSLYWNVFDIQKFDKKFEEINNCKMSEYLKKEPEISDNIFFNNENFACDYIKKFIKKKINI